MLIKGHLKNLGLISSVMAESLWGWIRDLKIVKNPWWFVPDLRLARQSSVTSLLQFKVSWHHIFQKFALIFYLDSNTKIIAIKIIVFMQIKEIKLVVSSLFTCELFMWSFGRFFNTSQNSQGILGACLKPSITLVPLSSHSSMSPRPSISLQFPDCLSDCVIKLSTFQEPARKKPTWVGAWKLSLNLLSVFRNAGNQIYNETLQP